MTAPRQDYDQKIKDLLIRAHDGFLKLIFPEARWRKELSPELPSPARRADLLWEVENEGRQVALHIEIQTRADPDIAERLLEYGVRVFRRYNLVPLSIVVYLTPTEAIPPSAFPIHITTFSPRTSVDIPFSHGTHVGKRSTSRARL